MLLKIIKQTVHHRKKIEFSIKTAMLCALLLWGIYELVGNKILEPLACKRIEQLTGTRVDIEDAKFQFNGIAVIKNLKIHSDTERS